MLFTGKSLHTFNPFLIPSDSSAKYSPASASIQTLHIAKHPVCTFPIGPGVRILQNEFSVYFIIPLASVGIRI